MIGPSLKFSEIIEGNKARDQCDVIFDIVFSFVLPFWIKYEGTNHVDSSLGSQLRISWGGS